MVLDGSANIDACVSVQRDTGALQDLVHFPSPRWAVVMSSNGGILGSLFYSVAEDRDVKIFEQAFEPLNAVRV